ncbi:GLYCOSYLTRANSFERASE [Salix viminalis]|uniref:Glycosyltransferase n=1 Tax=Salix viminalis TaxID=40686 RepID=A0A9Q0ZRG2_SALVM|nr:GLYCOSYLTRANSFERASE [Salix viminalis]
MPSPAASHVVIFPFMAQGHTLPLLDLSKALSRRQIKVTIITTPSNAKSIAKYVPHHPDIHLNEIPFPAVDGLPKGCENTSQLPSMEFFLPFLRATKQLRKPFEQVLETMALGVPRLVFHGMSVLSMAIYKSSWVNAAQISSLSVLDPVDLPGMKLPFTLTKADLETLNSSNHDDHPMSHFLKEVAEADANSWGVIINSFEELEKDHIPSLESFYMNGARTWCLGPLFLYEKMEEGPEKSFSQNQDHSVSTQWLNEQSTPDSVIYVSFGTQADVSDSQLDEVAFGLEESGFPFLWAVRSKTWSLPSGMEEKIKNRGLIVSEWVDQRQILSHHAVGGFLSHCGWNSVLESVVAGVPILAWPMIADQFLNAKLIVNGAGAGIGVGRVRDQGTETLVSRQSIAEGVEELMGGQEGRSARERAEALGTVARTAVQKGGSSHDTLSKFIDQLRSC